MGTVAAPDRLSIFQMNIVERAETDAFPAAGTALSCIKRRGFNLEPVKALIDNTAFKFVQPIMRYSRKILSFTDAVGSLFQ